MIEPRPQATLEIAPNKNRTIDQSSEDEVCRVPHCYTVPLPAVLPCACPVSRRVRLQSDIAHCGLHAASGDRLQIYCHPT